MNMRLWRATVLLTALVTIACPYDGRLTSNRGIAIGGGGAAGAVPTLSSFWSSPATRRRAISSRPPCRSWYWTACDVPTRPTPMHLR